MNYDLEKGFHQVDLVNMSAEQLTHFLTPFIEKAGFGWEIREYGDGKQKLLTIAKDLLQLHFSRGSINTSVANKNIKS